MPSATTTKSAMAGTKRKSAPVKNVHVKESKKVKIDAAVKMTPKVKKPAKAAPVQKPELSSDSDEDELDSDGDGGVPLGGSPSDEEGEEGVPNAADGLHPERAKAVTANSNYLPKQAPTVC
jgi:pumilio family protein 6